MSTIQNIKHARRLLLKTFAVLALSIPGACAQTRPAPVPEITKTSMWDVDFADSSTGIAVGDYGVIQRSNDGGRTWTPTRSSDQFAFRNVRFLSPARVVAAGFWSSVFVSDDTGRNWRKIHIEGNAHLPGMAAAPPRVWLSGPGGLILASTDSGETWTSQNPGTKQLLDAISFSDTLHGWCSSMQGALLRTTNGGLDWVPIPRVSALPATALWAVSPGECWVALFDGRIARTTDAGASWKEYPAYGKRINRLYFDSEGVGWAVGAGGVISRYDPVKGRWLLHSDTDAAEILSITSSGDRFMIAVGRDGTIIRIPRSD